MGRQNKKRINNNEFRSILAIFLGFWALFFVFYALELPIYHLMGNVIHVRSEYNVLEQLSKYYLFLVILISIYSYKILNQPIKIKMSICYLLLGLAMYLSESNMIPENSQPIFGFILIYTFFLLLRIRSWLASLLLLLGSFVISGGVLIDFVHENEFVKSFLTQSVADFLLNSVREELCDAIGVGFVCISVIICFIDTIKKFLKLNIIGTLGLLTASGMITIGNGFLHYQYRPSVKLEFVALIITISGFLGLILTNRYINKKHAVLTLVNEDYFYLFIFSLFVVLPTTYGWSNDLVSTVLWLFTIIFLGLYLYYRHPLQRNDTNTGTELE